MILKTLAFSISILLSTSVLAKVKVSTVVQDSASSREVFEARDLKSDLIQARQFILNGQSQSALYIIDRLIAQTGEGLPPRDFVRLGLVYNTSDSFFRCNINQQNQAIDVASRAAVNDCRGSGYSSCRIVNAFIRSNGYIGVVNGVYYGYGCVSEATARGF